MQIFRDSDEIINVKNSVVAVGAFDGVHLGHCKILNFLREQSANNNAKSVVITFDPHPRLVLDENTDFFTINNLEENLDLIEKQGIDIVYIQKFSKEFSKISYQDFIKNTLIAKLHASILVMGPNHSMGHNREGNHSLLKDFCEENNLQVVEIPEEYWKSAGIHSATIRNLIKEKRWEEVNNFLGYEYKIKR